MKKKCANCTMVDLSMFLQLDVASIQKISNLSSFCRKGLNDPIFEETSEKLVSYLGTFECDNLVQ